jgi:plasmid stabilization system protein ParE
VAVLIAADNVEAAGRVETPIYDACALLAEGPLRGHVRKDLTELPVRFLDGRAFQITLSFMIQPQIL